MKSGPGNLIIIENPFVHCVVGPVPQGYRSNYDEGQFRANSVTMDYNNVIGDGPTKFLEAELAGITKNCNCTKNDDNELKFDEMIKSSWNIVECNRFQVRLPWKIDPTLLQNNRSQLI